MLSPPWREPLHWATLTAMDNMEWPSTVWGRNHIRKQKGRKLDEKKNSWGQCRTEKGSTRASLERKDPWQPDRKNHHPRAWKGQGRQCVRPAGHETQGLTHGEKIHLGTVTGPCWADQNLPK